jgi:Fur family peroxide stress response transcriptional regulator
MTMARSTDTSWESGNRLETMLSRVKEKNFRLTPQRLAVLKILSRDGTHPSVAQVYERVRADFPTTSLAKEETL